MGRRAALLLGLSGFSALVYQTLWVKQLGLVVGVDVFAVTTGVAAFFAGLALGSYGFGRLADRSGLPVLVYAGLELGTAVLGAAVTVALAGAPGAFVRLHASVGPLAWLLPIVLVGTPAFLMGGTLPVLLRALEPGEREVGRSSGTLYAANTAGAILGVIATPFLLIPSFGVRGAALSAAALNLVCAVLAVMWRRTASRTALRAAAPVPLAREARLAVALYAAAGGVALGYEVVWSQAIVQFLSTRAFAFAVVLATYLLGLLIGAAVHARFADRLARPWLVFGLLITGAGLAAIGAFALLGPWLPALQNGIARRVASWGGGLQAVMIARFAVAAAAMVLPSTLLLGAAFPAAIRLVARSHRIGGDVGAVAGWNTAGGVAGTFLTGFVLVPRLGLIHTIGLLALGAALLGAVSVLRQPGRGPRSVALAATMVATAGALTLATPADTLARLLAATRGGRVAFYDESAGGTVAVLEQHSPTHTFRRLYIQGVSNSGDSMTSLRYMRLQALLPLLIHDGEPSSALVIGLGTGITAGALLTYPSLQHRVCAELLPAVVQAAPLFHGNYGAPTDPRLDIRVQDGRHQLLSSSERYDLITLEPPPPSAAGVVNLYSREFYELARDRLNQRGLLAQWWPLPTQNLEDSQSLVRAFLEVFPHVTLWTTELHEMMLVGSMDPIVLDRTRIAQRFAIPGVRSALGEVGIGSPDAMLATYVAGREELTRFAGDAPPVTDDRPRIEEAAWVRPNELSRVLPRVLDLARRPPLRNPASGEQEAIDRERRILYAFYQAGLDAYAGDRPGWAESMKHVLQEDPSNPYYRWFVGGARSGDAPARTGAR